MINQVDNSNNNLGIITDNSNNFLGYIIDNSNNITMEKEISNDTPVSYSTTQTKSEVEHAEKEQRPLSKLNSWYSRTKKKNPMVDSDDDSSIDNEEISKYSKENLFQSRIAALPVITSNYNAGSNALATLSEYKKDNGYETNSGSEMGNEQWDKMIKETETSNEEKNRKGRPSNGSRRKKFYDKILNDYEDTTDTSDMQTSITKSMLMGILSQLDIPRYEIDDIKKYVNDVFTTNLVTLTSTHLDMIGSYLNSQKMIYTESSYYTSTWLNYLMIPTIVISAGASVISGIEDSIPHAPLIISCITAFSAFLLSVINYLKLDAASEAHKISAHQYDKLHSHIMFFSGKSLLFSPASFNFNTRASREAKKKLEANKTVRNMLEDERVKSNTTIESIKKEYKLERASLDKEIQALKEEYSLVQNQIANETNELIRKERMHDILIRQDSSKAKLETLDNNYRKDREAESKKIDRFYEDLKQLRTEQEEEAMIQLNSEETKLQEDLMNDILKEIDDVQKKINEIKETNQFEVPKTIRNRYPTAYSINVFSLIKMIEGYKFILTIKLWIYRNQKRQMRYYIEKCCSILQNYNLKRGVKPMIEEEITRFRSLKTQYNDKINVIYESMVAISVAYIEIDGILQSEFEQGETKKFLGPIYYIFPCILRFFHDLSWYDTTLINHVYMSAGETRKKLSQLDTKSRSRIKQFLYSNDEMV
jgi:hypothetical protein